MRLRLEPGRFLAKIATAVTAQALLSAGNLIVSLILLRYGSDSQYGYYVLVLNAMILLASIQSSFIAPAMVQHMTQLGADERADLIGGLYRDQRRLLPLIAVPLACLTLVLWLLGIVSGYVAELALTAVAAGWATANREFFRMILNACRLPAAVLKGDFLYVLILIGGAAVAVRTAAPAITMVAFLCLAALCGAYALARLLRARQPWNLRGAPGILRKIARIGAWTAAGGVIHWSFSQGYNYLVVGTLDVAAVAAAASTRLVMMPVNLLSTGVSSLMLPTASAWVVEHGPESTFRRVTLAALGITGAAMLYLSIVWVARDLIFSTILHKHFAQLDLLLVLWSVTSIVMVFRDQVLYFLLARARYRSLTLLTLLCAIVSLLTSYWALLRIGVAGAPVGVLTGEVLNVAGLLGMSVYELKRQRA